MLSKEKNIICKYLAYVFTVFKSFMINFNKYTRIKECAWVWQTHSTSAKISYFFFLQILLEGALLSRGEAPYQIALLPSQKPGKCL